MFRGFLPKSVASYVVSLSQVRHKFIFKSALKVIDELVGCSFGANQLFVHHCLEITLHAATVDLWAKHLNVLNGQLPLSHFNG